MRILGIDPGSRLMGYGIIELNSQKATPVVHGTLVLHTLPFTERLGLILTTVIQLITEHQPSEVAIEEVFVQKNVQSALKLGQARGAAIAAAAFQQLPIFEYAARKIKQAVVGTGGAEKTQVQHMVKALLQLKEPLTPDSADALAIALCHSYHRNNRYARLLAGNVD